MVGMTVDQYRTLRVQNSRDGSKQFTATHILVPLNYHTEKLLLLPVTTLE